VKLHLVVQIFHENYLAQGNFPVAMPVLEPEDIQTDVEFAEMKVVVD
jgi:hypothetical protein